MAKRVFFLFLALWILAAPVLAVDNTVGVVQQDLQLVGLCIESSFTETPAFDFYANEYGAIPKRLSGTSDLSLNNQYVYLVFTAPNFVGQCEVRGNFTLSSILDTSDLIWYGGVRDSSSLGYARISLTEITSGKYRNRVAQGGNTSFNIYTLNFFSDRYDYYVCCFQNTTSGAMLSRGLSFSESASVSGSYNGKGYMNDVMVVVPEYEIEADLIMTDDTSTPIFQLYDSYDTIYAYSAGFQLGTITGKANGGSTENVFVGSSKDSGTMSLSSSGTLSASTPSANIAYGMLSAVYGGDGGLVDEVFDIGDTLDSIESETFDQGDTLDQIAGDMSQIVEDMQAKQDTANDIGGATTQDQIDNASATVTTGTAAINDFSDTALGSVQSHVGIFNGYAGLIGNALTIMGNFGTGALGTSWLLLVTVMIAMIAIRYALKSGG